MHSMYASAPDANTTPTIGGWALAAVAVFALVLLVKTKKKSTASGTTVVGRIRAVVDSVKRTARTIARIARAVWAIVRFFAGRELRGGPRSTATFLKAGAPTVVKAGHAVSMASIAAAPPKVSLLKKTPRQPSPWARTAASWLSDYRGRGATALDWTVRSVLTIARAAGKAWRFLRAIWRALRAFYRLVAPPVVLVWRTLRAWHCWPYAARALVRIISVALLVAYAVPAWRLEAILAMLTATALLSPLVPRLRPQEPSDDAVYGPRLWVILRDDLKLPEDEERQQWLRLPERLSAPDARVVLRLPQTFRGSEVEREDVAELVNRRLPGQWVARWSWTGDTGSVVFTHKPPPKPTAPDPEPPADVDLNDQRVQDILADLKPEEFLLGFDTFNEPVIRKMSGELSHWAYSVGSGGGKSTTLQWLAVQMLMKRGTIVGIDPKLISLKPLDGIAGVHLYKDPDSAIDMRRGMQWAADVTAARFFEIEQGTATGFPPLYVFLEEANELSGLLKAVWNRTRVKTGEDKEQAADPIWEDVVAYMLRFGRAANVHLIAVFQDFKDNQFGGTSLRPLFRLKILGNYDPAQWERITGMSKSVMPPNVVKAGRLVMADEGKSVSWQTPYLYLDTDDGGKRPANESESIDLYNELYRELRARHGYSDEGLYSEPPAVSPRGIPKLLRGRVEGLSRDAGAHGPIEGPEGGQDQETAGELSRSDASVTASEGSVTGLRDGLRLIPGQGGQEAAQDPTAPPELLPLAEIARRLEDDLSIPKDATMRAHKARRDDFPKGTDLNGRELYTISQIQAYYERQEKRA